jgi:putative flippase GtrA
VTAWLAEAARFGTVGVVQNGLNVTAFALATAVGVGYRAAAVVAGALALVASFLMNRHWTFMGRAAPVGRQAIRYVLVFSGAVAIGVVVLTLLVEEAGMAEIPAQVAAILLVAPLSFVAQRTWVFRRR